MVREASMHAPKGCDPTRVNADNLDAFVLTQVRQIIGSDRPAVEKAVDRFVKVVQAKAKPDDRRGQIEADLKAVNKRITSAMSLLADGDLDDLDELRETLVGLRKRRAALEAERGAAGAGDATPVNAGDLRAWALKRLDEIGVALETDKAVDAMREVVQAYVIGVEIDPKAKRGTLLLPADAMAILERDIASISRVNTGDAGFTAIQQAYFNNTSIGIACMDGDITSGGSQGLWADCSVIDFSRDEPLEDALSVKVTVKPTYSTNAPQWKTIGS